MFKNISGRPDRGPGPGEAVQHSAARHSLHQSAASAQEWGGECVGSIDTRFYFLKKKNWYLMKTEVFIIYLFFLILLWTWYHRYSIKTNVYYLFLLVNNIVIILFIIVIPFTKVLQRVVSWILFFIFFVLYLFFVLFYLFLIFFVLYVSSNRSWFPLKVVARTRATRIRSRDERMTQYFYGLHTKLHPHTFDVSFSKFKVNEKKFFIHFFFVSKSSETYDNLTFDVRFSKFRVNMSSDVHFRQFKAEVTNHVF